jgi:hypothetical protein
MIRLHYHVAHAIDECLRKLEGGDDGCRRHCSDESELFLNEKNKIDVFYEVDAACASTTASFSSDERDDETNQNGFEEAEALISSNQH